MPKSRWNIPVRSVGHLRVISAVHVQSFAERHQIVADVEARAAAAKLLSVHAAYTGPMFTARLGKGQTVMWDMIPTRPASSHITPYYVNKLSAAEYLCHGASK